MKNGIHKLMHWEYWNTNVIYFPIFFYWVYLSFKARSLGFFNASNPSIKNGGFALESKKDIYNLLPKKYYPQTLYFTANETLEKIHHLILDRRQEFVDVIVAEAGKPVTYAEAEVMRAAVPGNNGWPTWPAAFVPPPASIARNRTPTLAT